MAIPNADINYLAVLVSAVASMILGSLWYSPILFGNAWMKAGGIGKREMDRAKSRGMWKLYLSAFIGALITAGVLACLISYSGADNLSDGIKIGFLAWIGFVATALLGNVLWEGKNLKYYAITVVYHLVNLEIASIIISLWR